MNNYILSGTCSDTPEPVPDEKNLIIQFSPYFMRALGIFLPFTSCTFELKSVLVYVVLCYTVLIMLYISNFLKNSTETSLKEIVTIA